MYHQRFKSIDERFAEKFDKADDGCWIWKSGASRPDEHPKFWVSNGYRKASHFSWDFHNDRKLREGEQICHRCDNPRCVNPEHLFIGDHSANMADKAQKGRSHHPRGTLNGRAKITYLVADEIRAAYANGGVSQDALAAKYGLGQTTVSQIIRDLIWVKIA